jgi:hypothetical protein
MSCSKDEKCQALFDLIYAQSRLTNTNATSAANNVNSNNNNNDRRRARLTRTTAPWTTTTTSTQSTPRPSDLNQTAMLETADMFSPKSVQSELCRCISLSYKCQIEQTVEKNEISSSLTKNIFLTMYIALMVLSLAINIITFVLIISDHKKFLRKRLRRWNSNNSSNNLQLPFSHHHNHTRHNVSSSVATATASTTTTTAPGPISPPPPRRPSIKTKAKSSQIASLNNISDLLMVNLLISNLIITLYVLPNQIHLFYTNAHMIQGDCQTAEFLKAFSVSLSIYSLVSISFQRLIVIKYVYKNNYFESPLSGKKNP